MAENPVHAAIYLRISLDREMDGLAIERQREDCERIVEQRGWKAYLPHPMREIPYYVDQSKSATDKTKKRPEYDQMVADYEAGKFGAIVCYDLDRLTRQPRQLEDWIEAAEERGLVIVTANGDADLSTDGGRMYARVKAAVARAEVERKGARQHRAHEQRAQQGRPPHGVRPLGYDLKSNIIPHEAKAVEAIYKSFARGASLRGIAAALSGETGDNVPDVPHLPKQSRTLMMERNERRRAEGKPEKPVPEDGPWNPASVLGILRNPRYAGYSTYTDSYTLKKGDRRASWYAQIVRDDDGNPVLGTWEPIVDELTWWRVQEILNDPKRKTNRVGTERKHLGSGLYLCDICGKPVKSHSTMYRCAGHIMRSRKQVDSAVIAVVHELLGDPRLSSQPDATGNSRLKEIQSLIDKHNARIIRLQNDFDDEIIEAHDLKRNRDKERAAIAELESERTRMLAPSQLSGILGARNPIEAFDNADLATKRAVIDTLVTVKLKSGNRGSRKFDENSIVITLKR